jgi:hypothetical protein
MPSIDEYLKMILGEGMYASEAANLEAERAAEMAQTRAAIAGIFGDLGVVPQGYADPFGASAAAGNLASRNPYSTFKQIDRAHGQARGSMRANRAARGVIQSGGTALQEGEIGYNTGLNKYQAIRDAMAGVNQLSSGFAANQRQRALQYPDAISSAMERLYSHGIYPGGAQGQPGVLQPKKFPAGVRLPTMGPQGVAVGRGI